MLYRTYIDLDAINPPFHVSWLTLNAEVVRLTKQETQGSIIEFKDNITIQGMCY